MRGRKARKIRKEESVNDSIPVDLQKYRKSLKEKFFVDKNFSFWNIRSQLTHQLKKKKAKDLRAFFNEWFPDETKRKINKNGVREALVAKYFGETPSFMKRELEEENMKTMEIRDLDFVLCGTRVPFEIVREILFYLPFNMDLLVTVGRVNSAFYLLVLASWNETVRIYSDDSVEKISLLVLQNMRSFSIGSGLSAASFNFLFKNITPHRITIVNLLLMRKKGDLGMFLRRAKVNKIVFQNCRKLFLPKFGGITGRNASSDMSRRDVKEITNLPTVFPNVTCISNPGHFTDNSFYKQMAKLETIEYVCRSSITLLDVSVLPREQIKSLVYYRDYANSESDRYYMGGDYDQTEVHEMDFPGLQNLVICNTFKKFGWASLQKLHVFKNLKYLFVLFNYPLNTEDSNNGVDMDRLILPSLQYCMIERLHYAQFTPFFIRHASALNSLRVVKVNLFGSAFSRGFKLTELATETVSARFKEMMRVIVMSPWSSTSVELVVLYIKVVVGYELTDFGVVFNFRTKHARLHLFENCLKFSSMCNHVGSYHRDRKSMHEKCSSRIVDLDQPLLFNYPEFPPPIDDDDETKDKPFRRIWNDPRRIVQSIRDESNSLKTMVGEVNSFVKNVIDSVVNVSKGSDGGDPPFRSVTVRSKYGAIFRFPDNKKDHNNDEDVDVDEYRDDEEEEEEEDLQQASKIFRSHLPDVERASRAFFTAYAHRFEPRFVLELTDIVNDENFSYATSKLKELSKDEDGDENLIGGQEELEGGWRVSKYTSEEKFSLPALSRTFSKLDKTNDFSLMRLKVFRIELFS